MLKVSVVIPTLQKNTELLNNLIKTLDEDDAVSEIILIDNSVKGYDNDFKKLKVIVPEQNLFVNPSWNLGVEKAKEDIVALFNDDVTIPKSFCRSVIAKMTKDMGIIGFSRDFVQNTREIMPQPELSDLDLKKADGRCGYFGIIMFFNKSSYIKIPGDMKIFWGDDWLFYQNKKRRIQNYFIVNQIIYHYDGLSSTDKKVNPYSKSDGRLYRKYTRKRRQFIFNFEKVYKGFRITIFGLEFLWHYDKNH